MKLFMYSFAALVFSTGVAQAQDSAAPADAAEPPAPAAEGPAAPAADAGAAVAVSDSDIDSFAKATVKLQAIQADTSIADDQKQTKMQAAVTESGLDPAKYNEIGKAAQADPALRDKVRTAMAKHAGQTEG
ncbi:MAG: DUF4168 domain-containing protein [Porphyrobacter sp.]|nr:DUF4168 domain-containing protein [Porphyrobacter sp.]